MLAPWKDLCVSSLYLHSVSNEIEMKYDRIKQNQGVIKGSKFFQVYSRSLPSVEHNRLCFQIMNWIWFIPIWCIPIWWTQTQFTEGSSIPSGHVQKARLSNLLKVHSLVYLSFNSAGKLVNCTSRRVLTCKQYTLNPSEPI